MNNEQRDQRTHEPLGPISEAEQRAMDKIEAGITEFLRPWLPKIQKELLTLIEEIDGVAPTQDALNEFGGQSIMNVASDVLMTFTWRGKPVAQVKKKDDGVEFVKIYDRKVIFPGKN